MLRFAVVVSLLVLSAPAFAQTGFVFISTFPSTAKVEIGTAGVWREVEGPGRWVDRLGYRGVYELRVVMPGYEPHVQRLEMGPDLDQSTVEVLLTPCSGPCAAPSRPAASIPERAYSRMDMLVDRVPWASEEELEELGELCLLIAPRTLVAQELMAVRRSVTTALLMGSGPRLIDIARTLLPLEPELAQATWRHQHVYPAPAPRPEPRPDPKGRVLSLLRELKRVDPQAASTLYPALSESGSDEKVLLEIEAKAVVLLAAAHGR